nr:hypothetical protein [Tanacetum cinerariifolium]
MELEGMIGAIKLRKRFLQTMHSWHLPPQEVLQVLILRSDKGYHAVPPPFTENCMPPKRDLRLINEHFESVSVDVISNIAPSDVKTVNTIDVNHKSVFSTEEPKPIMKNNFNPPIIKDWHSDDESEVEISPTVEDTRPYNKFLANKSNIFNKKINTVRVNDCTAMDRAVVSGNIRREVNDVKASLLDESQVLLRFPRKDNIYSVDLKSIVPTRGLTCLFAKATLDESNLWHMRLRDNLGKFKRKANEGYFVGYSVKAPEVDKSKASDNDDQVPRSEVESLLQQERKTENINSTNSFNTISSPVNTVGSSFVNATSQTLINAARPSANDTRIFCNDYDDEVLKEEVHMNNVDASYTIPEATKFLKDHPQEQVIGSLETHKPVQALKDPSWVEAMQDELLQFKLIKVWTLVDLPKDKWAISTKWIYRNKKDERGIIIKKKSRLVTQGHIQEEGIDYDEVFAPVARIKAIRGKIDKTLFFKRHKEDILLVQVYVDDIIFGSTKKELSTKFEKLMHDKFQMSSIGELSFFLGLQVQRKSDGILISQNKYVSEVLKKFDFVNVKTASTLMKSNKPLIKDEEAEDTSHLHAVKRIFRYLKGQPKLGFWYPKDLPFDLEAYSDSDYAGVSLDRKSTTRGCQFLGTRLMIAKDGRCFVDTSKVTTGNPLLSTARLILILLEKDETVHKERGERMKRAATTTSSLEVDKKVTDQEQIQALVDKKKVIIMKDSIRSDFSFDDAEGTTCLLNEAIFKGLASIGTVASAIICLADNQKFNFSKYIFDNMVKSLEGRVKFYLFLRFLQVFLDKQVEGMARHKEMYIISSYTNKIFANIRRIGAGFSRKKQKPKRKQRKEAEVSHDESEDEDYVLDIQEAKAAQEKEIATLKKKVTKLNKWRKSISRGTRRLKKIGSDDETHERTNDDEMFRVKDLAREEVVMDTTTVTNTIKDIAALTKDVTEHEITLAQALATLKSAKPKVVVQEQEMSTTIPAAVTTVTTAVPTPRVKGIVFHEQKLSQITTVSSSKDKGKAKMTEPEVPIKKKDQMRNDKEYARKLEAKEEEAARLSRAQQDEEANNS